MPGSVRARRYDRSAVEIGLCHLGVGAFHRAHRAVFTDERGERDWGIVGASLRSPETRDALAPQDGLDAMDVRSSDDRCDRPPPGGPV